MAPQKGKPHRLSYSHDQYIKMSLPIIRCENFNVDVVIHYIKMDTGAILVSDAESHVRINVDPEILAVIAILPGAVIYKAECRQFARPVTTVDCFTATSHLVVYNCQKVKDNSTVDTQVGH